MQRAILLALLLVLASATRAEAAATRYVFDAALDLDTRRIEVRQSVDLTNPGPAPLDVIAFNVTPAHVGAFTLHSALVDGTPATTTRDGVVLRLRPAQSIAPFAPARVVLTYGIDVPSPGSNRFGFGGGIFALGNWYPVLFPLRDGAWVTHQYTQVGDAFYTETADYEMTLSLSRPALVAAPGVVQGDEPLRHRIVVTGIRDLALAVSDRYETVQRTIGRTAVTSYFLPEHRDGAAAFLDTAAEILPWLNEHLPPYRGASLAIAETWSDDPNQVGQEYPGLIFISSRATREGGAIGSYLSYLVAHEIVHQWFYSAVGNDQVREPWLDEAFATYLPERFFADRHPGVFATRWPRFKARLAEETSRLGARPIDGGIHDFADEGVYFAVVYRRGAAFLDDLRTTLGDAAFWRLLLGYVTQFDGGVARSADFLSSARAATDADLAPLLARYFSRIPKPPSGRYFPQAGGFVIADDDAAALESEFDRLGGVDALGYPASRRFRMDGFTVQVFQKAILQWRPEIGRAYFVNVLDRLGHAGKNDWLQVHRMTPPPFDDGPDTGLPWDRVVARHLAMLDADLAIRAVYFADTDPIARYGLPMSHRDMGPAYVVRAQRAVFQRWKSAVPWARSGQVTIANGGDLAKEAGILPAEALLPESP